jgi:hypothetical protein
MRCFVFPVAEGTSTPACLTVRLPPPLTSDRRQHQSDQVKPKSSHSFTSSATSSMIYLPAFDAFCLTSSATLPLVARIHKVLLGLGFVHPILVAHIHHILLCLLHVRVFFDEFTTEAGVIKDWRGCATHLARVVVVVVDEFKTEAAIVKDWRGRATPLASVRPKPDPLPAFCGWTGGLVLRT